MAWFRVDDGFPDHDKARLAGFLGRALWFDVGPRCAKARTDGVVAAHRLDEYLFLSGVKSRRENGRTAVQLLVASGLWHDHETIRGCDRCLRITGGLAEGEHYYHDWVDYQPTKDDQASPETKKIAARKKALHRDDALRELVFTRDHGRCRYCGLVVDPNPNNRRGRDGLTYDHVDPGCFAPNGGNAPEHIVVACRGCNSSKKARTAGEWEAAGGHPLRPAPPSEVEGELGDPGQNRTEPGHGSRGDGSGPDRVATGSGPGSDPGQAGPRKGRPGMAKGRSGSRAGGRTTPKARPP